ncbi:MAG: amidophosphoribosyltransferase [Selenomonas sp.]|uniref:amidophosphoribosyltransferase n=1 Tax=uncultured Selenomonas sp. TaxID=159275 RepID=UPI0025FCFE00|nr:amidophosphoribosyltransferase [uncultured Selenomonas sp.]MDY6350683.1 amidophosphoribosyltransferase [Selenomonas sp.]
MYDIANKWKEECGVYGVYSRTEDVSEMTYFGLYALQHRGQESAGIALTDGAWMDVTRGMGLVNEVFRHQLPHMENQYIAIGHVRYSTTGSSLLANTQPLMVNYAGGKIALAHNGNLTNAAEIRHQLEQEGTIFQTSIDSEVFVNLIARSRKETIEEKVLESLQKIQGAYCLTIMTEDKLIGARDPHGFRPLCIGKLDDGTWILSSETCGLDVNGAEFVRDVAPGEMVVIDDSGLKSYKFRQGEKLASCIFEYIYFARPDSVIDGQSVHAARFEMGRILARESKFEGDIVISVPDSGTTAATGYAYEAGLPFVEGLIKNRYIGRTFIQPTQKARDTAVKLKLNPIRSVVEGKRVIMVDDSIVRGTTSGKIVKMLRNAGAKAVYMCVSSPPIGYPCYYGIDTSVRKELIAATKSVEEIREYIGADGLHFLSLEGLKKSVSAVSADAMCYACFNQAYPVAQGEKPQGDSKYVFEQRRKC